MVPYRASGRVDAAVASPHRAPSAITSRLDHPRRGTKSDALLDIGAT
ncbi:MAG: hypothetical protein QOK16_4452, partial [Solirubrobacteraceae bacterium]|nr:hypothetical protein [Solirubrobacteraceae bacterium]